MNKSEFVAYIAKQNNITQKEAEKNIDIFVSSSMSALGEGKEISLIGFGNFSVVNMAARAGRNPRTGEVIQIKAYSQPKFKPGQKLKDAVNQR